MKWIFIVLFIANVALFGWEQNRDLRKTVLEPLPVRPIPAGTDRLVLLRELEKLPPVRPDAVDPPNGETDTPEPRAAPAAPTPLDLPTPETPATALEAETTTRQSSACLAIGPFDTEGEAAWALSWFENRNVKARQRTEERILTQRFWVYLEPQVSREAAQEKLIELENKGVQDFMLVQDNDMKNAISLGLYGDQDSVTRRVAQLTAQGFQPRVLPRHKTKRVAWLDVLTELDTQVFAEAKAQFESKVPSTTAPCLEIATQPLNP